MNVPEAVIKVLRTHPEGLTIKAITDEIIERNLYDFTYKDPQDIVMHAIRRHCIGIKKHYSCQERYFSSVKNSSTGEIIYKLNLSDSKIGTHLEQFTFPKHRVQHINSSRTSGTGNAMKMDAKNQTIRKLLELYRFTIPDYQRSYSWKSEEINEFLEDLYNILHNEQVEAHHFLGAMTMAKSKTNEAAMELIDGQQRMTTIFIILFIILEEYKSRRFSSLASKRADELYRRLAYLNDDGEFVDSRLVLGKFNSEFFEEFIVKGFQYSESKREQVIKKCDYRDKSTSHKI